MGLKQTDEFRQDAVRIALTSGLTRKQVADDLGVGTSPRNSPTRNGRAVAAMSGLAKAGCICRQFWTCIHGDSSAGL